MNLRVLKNHSKNHIFLSKIFRGRDLEFKPKCSKMLDWDSEEELAEYRFWKERYFPDSSSQNAFITDITSRIDTEKIKNQRIAALASKKVNENPLIQNLERLISEAEKLIN